MRGHAVGSDRFPRERVVALVGRLPRYARLAWSVGRDPALPRGRRAVLLAGAAYLASPIDLVPGFIPVAGQLDDAAAVLLSLRLALAGLPPAARQRHLRAAGLEAGLLDQDLGTVGITAAWMARGAARLGLRGARWLARRFVGRGASS